MYQQHFGLKRAPFKITPDTSLFYSGAERGSVLQALMYAVISGEGIIKVIGEVGTGKTMLCRMLEVKLADDVETVYIANPSLSPENILNVIAFELGLIDKPGNKLEVMQILQQWLLQQYSQGRHVVILIEEAQSMPLETLEEIRLLSNIETEQDKLMQIVLFGQPELDDNLSKPAIRQLNERIAHGFYLSPLKKNQIKDYLNFRIRNAGYHGPDLFDDAVSNALARHSKGLIRRVNILADKTLLAAFADGTTRLARKHAKQAIQDSGFFSFRKIPKMAYAAGIVGLLFGVISVGLLWWINPQSSVKNTPLSHQRVETTPLEVSPPQTQSKPVLQSLDEEAPASKSQAASISKSADLPEIENDKPSEQKPEVLAERLNATETWLKNADEREYSIQIMTVRRNSVQGLNDFLYRLPNGITVGEIFVYPTILNGEPMFGILYKTFNTRNLAVLALRNIPDELDRHRPFLLRTVKGVRNEIARSNG